MAAYVCDDEIDTLVELTKPIEMGVPSPQFTRYCQLASAPGSAKLAFNVSSVPTAIGSPGTPLIGPTDGATFAIVTCTFAAVCAPCESVTVSVAVYVPLSAYVCDAFAPVALAPSPKSQS